MRFLLTTILSLLLLTSPLFGQSERPESIVVPVSSLGDVSETRKQILQNTLEDELKTHFRLVPQETTRLQGRSLHNFSGSQPDPV